VSLRIAFFFLVMDSSSEDEGNAWVPGGGAGASGAAGAGAKSKAQAVRTAADDDRLVFVMEKRGEWGHGV
jgi:hypothetical protein